jgi:hypothetical protein
MIVAGQTSVFMLRGRLYFDTGIERAPFPSAVAVWGAPADLVGRMRRRCRMRGISRKRFVGRSVRVIFRASALRDLPSPATAVG